MYRSGIFVQRSVAYFPRHAWSCSERDDICVLRLGGSGDVVDVSGDLDPRGHCHMAWAEEAVVIQSAETCKMCTDGNRHLFTSHFS